MHTAALFLNVRVHADMYVPACDQDSVLYNISERDREWKRARVSVLKGKVGKVTLEGRMNDL